MDPGDTSVIFDFDFEDGLLFASVRNLSDAPAYDVSVTFDKPFSGLGGSRDTSELSVFRRIAFLAPHKQLRTLVDTTASYFAREQPAEIVAEVRWRTADGKACTHRIPHDLSIYEHVAYVAKKEPADGASA